MTDPILSATPTIPPGGAAKRSAPWIPTDDKLPPDGHVVSTLDSSGREQWLKRQGRLWFVPDGSMYVYYIPKYWQETDA